MSPHACWRKLRMAVYAPRLVFDGRSTGVNSTLERSHEPSGTPLNTKGTPGAPSEGCGGMSLGHPAA
jgi:hypothetical protein